MIKVRCKNCKLENNGKCTKKKSSVSVNKRRRCNLFVLDASKIHLKVETPSKKIGYKELLRNKIEFKKELKRIAKEEKNKKSNNLNSDNYSYTNNKYPLTGDLSRFVSTASSKGKEGD